MIRLVVFDLDGTLVDSSHDLAEATNALLAELGGAPLALDVVVSMVGEGAAVLVKRALERSGLDPEMPGALVRFLGLYDERLLNATRPYPGMIEALAALGARFRLAVLTNKPERPTLEILKGLEMRQFFGDVTGGDSAHGRKPNPAGLLDLAARAGVETSETILVGDSPVDLETSRRAGTRICLTRYGFGYRFAGTEFRGDEIFVDAAAELPGAIESINAGSG
jgi:phosphoglycolate phosphatase